MRTAKGILSLHTSASCVFAIGRSLDRHTISLGDEGVYRWGIGFGGRSFLFNGVERSTVDISSNGVVLFPESDEWYWPPRVCDLPPHPSRALHVISQS